MFDPEFERTTRMIKNDKLQPKLQDLEEFSISKQENMVDVDNTKIITMETILIAYNAITAQDV